MVEEAPGMGGTGIATDRREAASAMRWWLESGVDVAVQEDSRNWFTLAPAPDRQLAPAPVANINPLDHSTLSELRQWLSSSADLPLAAATAKRILPVGPENAPVMLLTDAPALEDFTAGRPIGGEAWELAQRMLAAIGIGAEESYSATLSCFHAPGSRMSEKERQSCVEIARHHIRLAKPQRLLLFGDGPSITLLGKPLLQARGHVHKIEGVRTVATFHPRQLLKRASDKALAWKDLLLLMEEAP
jgi:uracil-DNA glycosylase family 4